MGAIIIREGNLSLTNGKITLNFGNNEILQINNHASETASDFTDITSQTAFNIDDFINAIGGSSHLIFS